MRDSDSNSDQQEPSMEEILASIRRIISEDGDEIVDGGDRPASADEDDVAEDEPEPVVALVEDDDGEDDILELTDVIEDQAEEEPVPEPESLPDPEPEPVLEDDLEIADEPEPEISPEPEPEIETLEDDEKLVSDEVEEVSVASMSGLTAALASTAKVGDGDKTLEELTKELLRPVLKQWLDENLPDMVERIVREEVERIADRARK